jgi:hypothetical protein
VPPQPEANVVGEVFVAVARIEHARDHRVNGEGTKGVYKSCGLGDLWIRCARQQEPKMATGKGPASKAGKELRSGKSTKEERTVSASDLSQAPRKPKKK